MANELQQLAEWTFLMETKPPKGIQDILVDGEDVVCCFKTVRDVAIFTNKRLIVRDTQGMTGIKKEIYSLPYKSINMYTTENAGIADINTEIELWTRIGRFKLKLKPGADVKKIDRIIATYIL
ncbi:MAG: PH domain-containing protein [Oscillospiraceae bacterium]|nr:PH domain-containing protein [Oscillospiraceae bacterium]